jgi:hypothetical protein
MSIIKTISRAMGDPDTIVVEMIYTNKQGVHSRRVVSPTTWTGKQKKMHFRAYCLSRCEYRQFEISRISQAEIKPAADFVAPVLIQEVAPSPESVVTSQKWILERWPCVIRNAVRQTKPGLPYWSGVRDVIGCGSTYAIALCRAHGEVDPHDTMPQPDKNNDE